MPEWLNRTVPWDSGTPKLLRQCRRYNATWTSVDQCLTEEIDYDMAELINCDSGWVYDLSDFQTSIVTEVLDAMTDNSLS